MRAFELGDGVAHVRAVLGDGRASVSDIFQTHAENLELSACGSPRRARGLDSGGQAGVVEPGDLLARLDRAAHADVELGDAGGPPEPDEGRHRRDLRALSSRPRAGGGSRGHSERGGGDRHRVVDDAPRHRDAVGGRGTARGDERAGEQGDGQGEPHGHLGGLREG